MRGKIIWIDIMQKIYLKTAYIYFYQYRHTNSGKYFCNKRTSFFKYTINNPVELNVANGYSVNVFPLANKTER